MAGEDKPTTLRANMIGYFTIVLIGLAVTYYLLGLFNQYVIWRTALLVPSFIVGIFIGSLIFPYSSERVFRNIALLILACSATYVLLA